MELRALHVYRSNEIDLEVDETTIGKSVSADKKTQMLADYPTWFEEVTAQEIIDLDTAADTAEAAVVTAQDALDTAVSAEATAEAAVTTAAATVATATADARTKRGKAAGQLKVPAA